MRVLPDQPILEKTKYSILDTIIKCGYSPKKSGKTYLLNCPFHNDKTPSLIINPEKQTWKCYGNCSRENNGGDAIDFVRQHFHYSFTQAVNWLENNSQTSFNIKWEPPEKPKIVPDEFVLYWHSLMDLEGKRDYFRSRGFEDWFIDQELWGWDGDRYVLPVWEGEPGNSQCLGVRRRTLDENLFKYIGLNGYNQATVWGRYYCQSSKKALALAGEFDSARAVCDKFPAFSLVNGCQSFLAFPKDWPNLWFPNVEELVVVFDQGEEIWASRFAGAWNDCKGLLKAKVFRWPFNIKAKDYCQFRELYPIKHFQSLLQEQGLKL